MIILSDLMALAANERTSNQVRAIASLKLDQLKTWLARRSRVAMDEDHLAFLSYARDQIKRFQEDPKKANITPAQQPPDGQPIGMDDECNYRW
jgi:sulfur relay (sulfurtransferase) DsrC/TusE family protein